MTKFKLDVEKLGRDLCKRSFRLSEVEPYLEKVAFDVVRFKDQDEDCNLWQIQKGEDGEYIVALYAPDEMVTKTASSAWSVKRQDFSSDLRISYKGEQVIKLASSQLGIPAEEISLAISYLPEKLAQNARLRGLLLKLLPPEEKQYLAAKFPELK